MIDEEKKVTADDETPKDIVVELPDEDTTDNQVIETVETTEEPSDTEVPEEEVVEEEAVEGEEPDTVEEETEEPKDNKVFGKRAEKRIKRLVAQKKELEEKLKGYESEKDKWLDEKSELKSRQADSELDAINQYMERLESQEAQALSVLRTAKEASDVDAEIKATDVLASVKAEKLVAKQYKARAEKGLGTKKPDSTARTETKVGAKPNTAQLPDRKALAWQKRNKWFGGNDTGDRIKTQAALVIHKELLDEGINPQDVAEEYYSELDARLTTEFPTLRKHAVRRVPTVVGGTRSATGKRKVTLTGQEIEMADRLGVTYQDYAREKLRQDKAGS